MSAISIATQSPRSAANTLGRPSPSSSPAPRSNRANKSLSKSVVSWRGDLSSVQREEGSRRTRNSKRPKSAEKDVKEEVSSGSVTTTEYVVQPTGTLGLLSLSKPIPTVSPSPEKSSRRRTARSGQWRERRGGKKQNCGVFICAEKKRERG